MPSTIVLLYVFILSIIITVKVIDETKSNEKMSSYNRNVLYANGVGCILCMPVVGILLKGFDRIFF
jgi:hypothetical protein